MVACIYKSPSKWKSPKKGTFPFKWKNIRGNHIRSISLKKLRLVASNKSSFRKQPSMKQYIIFFAHNIKMPNLHLSLDDLKILAKIKDVKGYKIMYQKRLKSSFNESKPMKENNFDSARIEKIKKYFNKLRDRLSKPKIKEIIKDNSRTENKK